MSEWFDPAEVNPLLSRMSLDIDAGTIRYRLYRQDGSFQPMRCPDSPMNRIYVSWFKAHDRYGASPTHQTGES